MRAMIVIAILGFTSALCNAGPSDGRDRRRPEDDMQREPVRLRPETLSVGNPQPRVQPKPMELSLQGMLQELREIQGGSRRYCILGTRYVTALHEQIIELLSYALVLSDNHLYTSGAQGTNAAAIRGALRAEKPELLTVVLPQSIGMQPPDCQELVLKVKNVVEMPENDGLSLGDASDKCNLRLIEETDQLIAFAFHGSKTVINAATRAEDLNKIVTIMYLD